MPWLRALMICLLCGNMLCLRLWDSRTLSAYSARSPSRNSAAVSVTANDMPSKVLNENPLKSLNTYDPSTDCIEIAGDIGCNTYSSYTMSNSHGGDGASADAIENLNNLFEDKLTSNNVKQQVKSKHKTEQNGDADLRRYLPMLPTAYYNEFYEDLIGGLNQENVKRNKIITPPANCDCKIENNLLDLGADHFPRFLVNAICQTENAANEYELKCPQGTFCRKLEYKVKVLTFRMEHLPNDNTLLWLPDDLRHLWKFKTVTVAAGCFCGP